MSLLPFVAWSREQRDFHLELQHQGLVSRNHGDEVEESSDLGPNAEQDGASPNSHKHFFPYMGFCALIWDNVCHHCHRHHHHHHHQHHN